MQNPIIFSPKEMSALAGAVISTTANRSTVTDKLRILTFLIGHLDF